MGRAAGYKHDIDIFLGPYDFHDAENMDEIVEFDRKKGNYL